MSQRLGIILIGIGLLLWGLHVESKYEGFQGAPPAAAPAPALDQTAPSNSTTPDTYMFDKPIIEDLKQKITEIKSKFNLINNIKLTADTKITTALSDTDTMSKINILFYEVKSFVNNVSNLDLDKFATDTSGANDSHIAAQLIYTVYDQIAMLYRIYYTIPSLIISSGIIIPSDTATAISIVDTSVIQKAAPQIAKEVAGIPSAAEQLTSAKNVLTMNANDLQKNYSDITVSVFQDSLTKYLMIVDIEISNMDVKIFNLESSPTISSTPDIKFKNIINAKILFLNGVITTLKTVHDSVNKLQNQNSGISNSIETSISSYTMALTTTRERLVAKEGFQSYGNSYNAPSPNITQAYEFRLGKRQYADDVFSGIKLFT